MRVIKNIAIIPARGGSKRIPRKNIKDFFGKAIIGYSIESTIKSNLFDEVIVSTDDDEIKLVAESFGAIVPFLRSQENADDYATLSDVLVEVVSQLNSGGAEVENICCILPTAPFITPKVLNKSFNVFIDNQYESLYPVLEFSYPIQRMSGKE